MIILNACNNVKIQLDDSKELSFFSTIPNPSKDFEMRILVGVIVDERTASFLRDFPIEWLKEGDQLLGVNVDASDEVCRGFLKSCIVDAKILLDDE